MPGDLCTAPRIISLSSLSLATDVTEGTLGASGLWLGTRTRAGGTATLTESFFARSPWLHGQQFKTISQPQAFFSALYSTGGCKLVNETIRLGDIFIVDVGNPTRCLLVTSYTHRPLGE